MRNHSGKVNLRSFHKDQIKKPLARHHESPAGRRKSGRDNHAFVMNAAEALSATQKGILVVSLLLLTGAGLAMMSGASSNRLSATGNDYVLTNTAVLTNVQHPACFEQTQGMRNLQHAFFSQPALSKNCVERATQKPSLFYKGLLVRDVSENIENCGKKTHGKSAGKICDIDGVRHYLKVVETENEHPGSKTNSLLGVYNLALINNNLGVTVPSVFIAFEEKGAYPADEDVIASASFYVASKSVENFTTGSDLIKKITREHRLLQNKHPFLTQSLEVRKREQIVSKIGESGLAKLAVAGTFFQDVVNNDGNWGYDKNGLVIVDADNSPGSLAEYIAEAARVPRNIELDFSINTIKAMRKNYQSMLEKGLPVIHQSVDMDGLFYQSLVKLYIGACDKALLRLKTEYPTLPAEVPTTVVNDILSEGFLDAMACARHNGLFLEYKRYEEPATESRQVGMFPFH